MHVSAASLAPDSSVRKATPSDNTERTARSGAVVETIFLSRPRRAQCSRLPAYRKFIQSSRKQGVVVVRAWKYDVNGSALDTLQFEFLGLLPSEVGVPYLGRVFSHRPYKGDIDAHQAAWFDRLQLSAAG